MKSDLNFEFHQTAHCLCTGNLTLQSLKVERYELRQDGTKKELRHAGIEAWDTKLLSKDDHRRKHVIGL